MVGKRADYRTYGAFGATIGETSEARRIVAEAFRFAMTLNSGIDLELVDRGQVTEAMFQVTAPSRLAPHHYAECQIYVVHHFMQLLFGPDWAPVRVQFRHERLGTIRSYENVFGCEVGFGQATAGVVLKTEDMDRSLAAVDTPIGAMVQQMLEEASEAQERTTVSAVGSLLPPLLSSGKATIEHIAPLLGVSERTLQRRLRDEGSSLRQIIHGERLKIISKVMACGLPPGETMGKLLGFSDASAASRFLREHSPAPALRSADGTGGEPE
jgi:AraC-like DNA-binding protein